MLRRDILLYYADAIDVILRSGSYASQELRDLEKEALRISTYPAFTEWALVGLDFTVNQPPQRQPCASEKLDELLASEIRASCLEPLVHTNEFVIANVGGGVSLVRLIAYDIRSGAPAAARANAFADFADWHLFSTRTKREVNEMAIAVYERAYREVRQDDEARESMFSPEVPIAFVQPPPRQAGVPLEGYTRAPNLFASATAPESSRFIDVSFEITKFGWGERIEILETSQGATRDEERDLVHLIEVTRFRPRFVDGKLADSAAVVVRYDLNR
jgi:hypothetical protein